MKKIISVLLTLAMVLAIGAITIFASPTTLTVGTGEAYTTIQSAINFIRGDSGSGTWTINVKTGTYAEDLEILQQVGKNIELFGVPGTTITGGITVDGDARVSGTETLLIKNIIFDKSGETLTVAENLIALQKLSSSANAYGYTHNVTIEDCMFIGDLSGANTVGIRAGNSGGNTAYNTTIKNCSFRNLHSAVQARCMSLTIIGCTTENMSEGGVNTVNSTDVSIVDSQIGGGKYGLRMGENGTTFTAGTVVIRNSEISGGVGAGGEGAIYLRGSITADLDIDESDILGKVVNNSGNVTLDANSVFFSGTIMGIDPADITITNSRDGKTVVTANVGVTYTVIIPSSVNFGTIYQTMPAQSKDFSITVQDALLESGKKITVAKTSTVDSMSDGKGNVLAFTFTPATEGFVFAGNGTQTGSVSCTPASLEAAGFYSGYMTFSVTYAE